VSAVGVSAADLTRPGGSAAGVSSADVTAADVTAAQPPDAADVVVIGAGVVGLAVARAFALAGREVLLLEQGAQIGQGISSRNSEVVHAGLYYGTGSLKARLCVAGKQLLYAYAQERGFAVSQLGKLVVATDPSQIGALAQLVEQARVNGVVAEHLTGEQARAMEPALGPNVVAAVHSPSTGIVDSHAFMLALQGDFEQAGGVTAYASAVTGIDARRGSIVVKSSDFELAAKTVINASGLHAVALAQATLGLPASHVPQARFAKGSYFALAGRAPFSKLIYPAHSGAWLGVHLTLDLGGQAKFGPDLEWLPPGTAPEDIDFEVDPARGEGFYEAVRRYWPGLPDGALVPSYSGVRPKIHAPGEAGADFLIQGPADHGISGLVNLLGIESPGLTSALAIGQYVVGLCGRP
jgi:L-2-hydroxyglutarate oxidase LhgO